MTIEKLPPKLITAIEQQLSGIPAQQLALSYDNLKSSYQEGRSLINRDEQLAYLAGRMPATYGVLSHLLGKFLNLFNSVNSALDIGSGPGTFGWVASQILPSLNKLTCIEKEPFFLELSQKLACSRLERGDISYVQGDIGALPSLRQNDMVILSYVLNELPEPTRSQILTQAFTAASRYLLIIEPGTPQGFANMLNARTKLIEMGASIIAPCPHNKPCPIASLFFQNKDWCHFSVRIERPPFQRLAKEASLPYEDEKFCYLIAAPYSDYAVQARVIRPPYLKTGHVILDVCEDGKIERKIITKKDKEAYRLAKKVEWGEEWPYP